MGKTDRKKQISKKGRNEEQELQKNVFTRVIRKIRQEKGEKIVKSCVNGTLLL